MGGGRVRAESNDNPVQDLGLAALLGGAGVSHLIAPDFYDRIVPHFLPGKARSWTTASGMVEIACAVTVANRRSRRVGARVAAWLFVAVFPANLQMAWDWRGRPAKDRAVAYGRLPIQVLLVWWALRVHRVKATRPRPA